MDRFGGGSRVLLAAALALVAAAMAVRLAAPGRYSLPLVWLLSAAVGLIAAWGYIRYRTDGLTILPVARRIGQIERRLLAVDREDEIAHLAAIEIGRLLDTDRAALVPVRHGRLVVNRGSGRLVIDPGHERSFVRDIAVRRRTVNVVTNGGPAGHPVALIGVPVILDAAVVGVLVAVRDPEHPFTKTERHVLTNLASVVAAAVGAVRERWATREAAHHDQLTALPGPRLLERDLARVAADRRQSQVAVAVVAIDRLSRIVGQHGEGVGDQVVAAVADVARHQIRLHDTAYRIAPDRLAVLLRGIRSDQAVQALDRIRRAVRHIVIPTSKVGEEAAVSVSIGVSFVYPGDPRRCLEEARSAAVEASQEGGDRVTLALDSPFDQAGVSAPHPG